MRSTEYPRPRHVFAHISDTHLTAQRAPLYGAMDSWGRLQALLDRLVETGLPLDAILMTGDLADRGDVDAYQGVKEMVELAAQAMNTTVVWAMGNHDDRAHFRQVLLPELPGEPTDPVDSVTMFDGLRVITVDSSVPQHAHGELTESQLAWLADVLATPAPEGSLLIIHHPPMPTVQDVAVTCELLNQHTLADVVRGSDIRSILSGHVHYTTHATFAGIPVSAVASAAYTQDLFTPDRGTRGRDDAQGLNIVEVYDEIVMHTAYPLTAGTGVGRFIDGEESTRLLAEAGIEFKTR